MWDWSMVNWASILISALISLLTASGVAVVVAKAVATIEERSTRRRFRPVVEGLERLAAEYSKYEYDSLEAIKNDDKLFAALQSGNPELTGQEVLIITELKKNSQTTIGVVAHANSILFKEFSDILKRLID